MDTCGTCKMELTEEQWEDGRGFCSEGCEDTYHERLADEQMKASMVDSLGWDQDRDDRNRGVYEPFIGL